MTEEFKKKVGLNIKYYREKAGLTLKELGAKVGKSESTMQKYEAGNINSLDVELLSLIASALNCAPENITGWNGNPEYDDTDIIIIQRERSKMTEKEKTKLMNILKANFDDFNWDEDYSGDYE